MKYMEFMGGPQESHEPMVVHIKEQINNLMLFILAFKNIVALSPP